MEFNKKVTISANVDAKYCRSMLVIAGFSVKDKSDDEIINEAISLIAAYGFDITNVSIADSKSKSDNCSDLPVMCVCQCISFV